MLFMFSLLAAGVQAAPPHEAAMLEVDLQGLRNTRGVVQVCLTRDRQHFPDCKADPNAVKRTIPAREQRLTFSGLVPGDYAVALFHDENGNGKLDTLLGIPKEGFGFSRNPVVRFGAPRYEQVSMQLGAGFSRIVIRLQYLL